jgi:hypothetical protein
MPTWIEIIIVMQPIGSADSCRSILNVGDANTNANMDDHTQNQSNPSPSKLLLITCQPNVQFYAHGPEPHYPL